MKRLDRYEDIWQLQGGGSIAPLARRVHFLNTDRLRPIIRYAHEAHATPGGGRIIYDFCLLHFPESSGSLTLGATEVPFGPRTLVLIPPFVWHQFHFEPGITQHHIAVHLDLAPDFPDPRNNYERQPYEVRLGHNLVVPTSAHLPAANNVFDSLKALLTYWQEGTAISRLLADERLFQVIALALTLGQEDATETQHATARARAAVAKVVSHLRTHLADPLTPEDMASLVDMSASHLARCFRSVTGCAPRTYLTRLRVQQARQMLSDPSLTVKQIAAAVGFDDPRQFSIAFHKLDGLSPTQYREVFPHRGDLPPESTS